MQSFKYIIAICFLIGVIICTMEITKRMYKCPDFPDVYKEPEPEPSVTLDFGAMFTDPTPGLVDQLLYDKKIKDEEKTN